MVVRDRIKELSKIPVGQVEKTEDGHGRRSPDQDNNLEGENFVLFLYQIEKINSGVEQIKENNGKIKETQKHFFDEPSTAGRERYQDEHKILMKENKRLVGWLQNNLKEEEEKLSSEEELGQTTTKGMLELHIKSVQLSAGRQFLMKIWADYNTLEVKFRERMRTELVKSIAITDSSLGEEEIEEKLEQGNLSALPTSILQDTSGMVEHTTSANKKKKLGLKIFSSKNTKVEDPAEAAKQLELLEKRREDMMRLEQEIVEIHTVFMDLATIVNQKWEELNRIEDHLNALVTKMEQTKNKMEEADAEQNLRKKRRKKFLLVALLALLVIFIIIGASSGGEDGRNCKVDPSQLDHGECLCDHFLCGDRLTCVPPNKLCNGVADCPLSETSQGGEDEEGGMCWDEGDGSGFGP